MIFGDSIRVHIEIAAGSVDFWNFFRVAHLLTDSNIIRLIVLAECWCFKKLLETLLGWLMCL